MSFGGFTVDIPEFPEIFWSVLKVIQKNACFVKRKQKRQKYFRPITPTNILLTALKGF
jgi:hypothetical protein